MRSILIFILVALNPFVSISQSYSGTDITKSTIKSNELSTFDLELGDYVSIKGYPKAKGVNLKLKVPIGWKVKDGNRPYVVKKFIKESYTYLIMVEDNVTFLSRNQSKELLQDENYIKKYVQEISSMLKDSEVLDQSVITIETYPAILLKVKGTVERLGISKSIVIKYWIVYYEDKIVFLQSMGIDNAEYKAFEQLCNLITNSVVFPNY